FGKHGSAAAGLLVINGQIRALEQRQEELLELLEDALLYLRNGRQVVAQDLSARIKMPGIEEQGRVAVKDAGPCVRRRQKAPQHWGDTLRVDRKIQAVELAGRWR